MDLYQHLFLTDLWTIIYKSRWIYLPTFWVT